MEGAHRLSRPTKDVVRLNYMHEIIKQICGFLLEPRIPKTGTRLKMADIGAGTGIWAVQILDELPFDATVTVFDVSDAQFPLRDQLPSRVHVEILDAFKPFPKQYHGFFDVVNIKLFKALVDEDNVETFVQNVMQILKPGGYIQWLDFEVTPDRLHKGQPDLATPWIEKMMTVKRQARGGASWDWVSSQANFSAAGLKSIDTLRIKWDTARFLHLVMHFHCLTLSNISLQMEREGRVEAAKPLQDICDQVPVEIARGSGMIQDFILLIGRKSGI